MQMVLICEVLNAKNFTASDLCMFLATSFSKLAFKLDRVAYPLKISNSAKQISKTRLVYKI